MIENRYLPFVMRQCPKAVSILISVERVCRHIRVEFRGGFSTCFLER